MCEISLKDEAATLALGARIARFLQPGDVIALTGDLGAGKTTFSRGCIRALTNEEEVPSPTYTLVQTYDVDDFEIWHCDLYRLERPADVIELGFLDVVDDVVLLIEWPDKMGEYLPSDRLTIDFKFKDNGRDVSITGGPGWTGRMDVICG